MRSVKDLCLFGEDHVSKMPFLEGESSFFPVQNVLEAGDEFEDVMLVLDVPASGWGFFFSLLLGPAAKLALAHHLLLSTP